ncbi:MAG: hypothetical protein U0935_14275 [Pirellulales bacterium]
MVGTAGRRPGWADGDVRRRCARCAPPRCLFVGLLAAVIGLWLVGIVDAQSLVKEPDAGAATTWFTPRHVAYGDTDGSTALTDLAEAVGVAPVRGPAEAVRPVIPAVSLLDDEMRPRVLDAPLDDFVPFPELAESEDDLWVNWPIDPPLGFAGRSGIAPREFQQDPHFVPREDRWRIGFPAWDRYGQGFPWLFEYPYVTGNWWDPYHQNLLKGDYPIWGQHTFLSLTAVENLLVEARQTPTPTTPFESTARPGQEEFFGDPDQFFLNNNLSLTVDLTHGDGPFRPADWRLRVTQVYNFNHLVVDELGIVSPDVRRGTARFRQDYATEEYFLESKLADLSADYDFLSVRAGSQFFNSDFRGLVFWDINRGVRLFGTRRANREQFNLMWLDQTEKDTNSLLNTWDDRHQNTVIANYYWQDFLWPGYTTQLSYHYNRDQPSFKFNDNGFLVRPDPVGIFAPHEVNAHYLGWAGDGHIGRVNVSHALYGVIGADELSPIAGQEVKIAAWMAALELSYDRDWMRFRSSYFYASGDADPNDDEATGFDTIFDNPNFAGGGFSFWQRQPIGLFGVNLKQRNSLVPDLRSSKFQGQSNFVNPGLHLLNFGLDADITPRFRLINNVNFLWFDQTEVLETLTFQADIATFIGADLSSGFEYRPLLNNHIVLDGGVAVLIPGAGFNDLYAEFRGDTSALAQIFANLALVY